MSILDGNLGDTLDDPGFRQRQGGGNGGRSGGGGGPTSPGAGGGYGGFFGSATMGGGTGPYGTARRIQPGSFGGMLGLQQGSLPGSTAPGGWMADPSAAGFGGSRGMQSPLAMSQVDPSGADGGSGGGGGGTFNLPAGMGYGQASGMGGGGRNGRTRTAQANAVNPNYWMDLLGIPRAPANDPNGTGPNPNGNWWDFYSGDPWGNGNFDQSTSQLGGLQGWLLQQAGKAGVYDPSGNRAMMDAARTQAINDTQGLAQRGRTAANLYAGNDPSAAAYANLRGTLDASKGVSDALSATNLAGLQDANRLQQGILMGALNHGNQWDMATHNAQQQKMLGRLGQGGGGWGSWLGNAAGSALPYLFQSGW